MPPKVDKVVYAARDPAAPYFKANPTGPLSRQHCLHDEHIIDGRKGGMLSSGCCLYVACGCCRLRAAGNAGQHRRGRGPPEARQWPTEFTAADFGRAD
jgi:hypothetical protein